MLSNTYEKGDDALKTVIASTFSVSQKCAGARYNWMRYEKEPCRKCNHAASYVVLAGKKMKNQKDENDALECLYNFVPGAIFWIQSLNSKKNHTLFRLYIGFCYIKLKSISEHPTAHISRN